MSVESFLEHGATTRNGGDRYQIIVNADATVLADDTDGTCELDDGPALAPETVVQDGEKAPPYPPQPVVRYADAIAAVGSPDATPARSPTSTTSPTAP